MQGRGHNFMKLFQKIQIQITSNGGRESKAFSSPTRKVAREKTYLEERERFTDKDKNKETLYF